MLSRNLVCILTIALATACHPKFPNCHDDSDCSDADNHGLLVHCIDGQCQECKASADCGPGKTCQSMRCVAAVAPPAAAPVDNSATQAAAPQQACTFPTVHFDFNSSELSQDAEQALQQAVTCLQTQASAHIRIEGDCDERGTEEYNLALGQRRASQVEKYLENLGVHRLGTISYGKDRPVCNEDSERCWRRNRRAEFDVGR